MRGFEGTRNEQFWVQEAIGDGSSHFRELLAAGKCNMDWSWI
jgi:hypothetical protein